MKGLNLFYEVQKVAGEQVSIPPRMLRGHLT